jgi:hypothetical protein
MAQKSNGVYAKLRLLSAQITLAALLVILGVVVLPHGKDVSTWIDEARRAIAGALLATGMVSILYDHLFVRRVIGGYFEILKAAAGLELDRIYVDRSQALEDITSELRGAGGNIKIMCVSGSDFFETGPAADAISDLVVMRKHAYLRFLLLKPSSRYAFLRAWVEEKYSTIQEDQDKLDVGELTPDYKRDEFRESAMQVRIDAARAALRNMSATIKAPTKLSARFYVYQPSIFLVAVNNWIFVEQYHWGVDRDFVRGAIQPCIAKRVPVLKFRRSSFNGMIFESHFDRVWRCSQTERFLPAGDSEETIGTEKNINI